MIVLESPEQLREQVCEWKREGHRVGFVPTMGYLHHGHLSLMRLAKEKADRVVASIFVNPRQFGPEEDLDNYPRDEVHDKSAAEEAGVDVLFFPSVELMYPEGYQTNVHVDKLSQGMCGTTRPTHFDGVATVITKFFNIVNPDLAVFGEKDFQQLALIRRLTRDLNFPIEIIGHPIVREDDGLAMSSRNKYLEDAERTEALALSRSLQMAKKKVDATGSCLASELHDLIAAELEKSTMCSVDYISIVDSLSLDPVEHAKKGDLIALAVYINQKVRLIDNIVL